MPILIDELNIDLRAEDQPAAEADPPQLRTPMSDPEFELNKTLALLEERRARLRVD